jgi:hypothetical protein
MAKVVAQDEGVVVLPASIFQVSLEAIRPETLGISVYVIQVTPALAELWLNRAKENPAHKNRSIHHSSLAKLKRAMEGEMWELNGEPLIFDEAGFLIEGQHRCLACVQSNTAFYTLVVHGINGALFRTMGQGAKRSVGDILSILGKANSRTLGAALRWIWRYEHGQMMNAHPTITEYEVANLEEQHPTLHFSVPYGHKCRGMAAPALITALHYLCRKIDEAQAETFFAAMAEGANLPQGHPVLFLRRYLLPKVTGRGRAVIRDERKAPVIINTWNLLRKDPEARLTTIQKIIWQGRAGQPYPVIS